MAGIQALASMNCDLSGNAVTFVAKLNGKTVRYTNIYPNSKWGDLEIWAILELWILECLKDIAALEFEVKNADRKIYA